MKRWLLSSICGTGLLIALSITGCQVSVRESSVGNTDVEFFPVSEDDPEIKLSSERVNFRPTK